MKDFCDNCSNAGDPCYGCCAPNWRRFKNKSFMSEELRKANPDHLFLGNHKDNMKDAAHKNRMKYGTSHHNAKLNDNKVRKIRREYKFRGHGNDSIALGRKYGVSREKLKIYGDSKARATAAYDKALSITLIQLKNGKRFEVDGCGIENPPASTAERIAKGLPDVFNARLALEVAQVEYASLSTFIDTIGSELSALQSIYRSLSNV